ncbi:glycosyltransferase [Congregicoccus parvus]|uniref:glycosyltransferase n=1 Tax=Congregicoccus parvus TaxID=3081749 RepID=UPI003FA5B1A0
MNLGRYTEKDVEAVCRGVASVEADVFSPNCFLPAYYACRYVREWGVATIGVLHSDDPYYSDIVEMFIDGDPAWRLSGVAVVSRYLGSWLESASRVGLPTMYAPCGVPVPERAARREPGMPFRVVYSGRLVERQKRISRVVAHLVRTVGACDCVEAVIYGDGSAAADVAETVRSCGLGARLRMAGGLDPDGVLDAMQSAHAMVQLSEYEGLSISLLEAMACGVVPIVARTRSGFEDVLREGENCLVVESDDEDSVRRATLALVEDPETWSRLSRCARASVSDARLTSEECAARWKRFLDSCAVVNGRLATPTLPRALDIVLPPLTASGGGIARVDARGPRDLIRRLVMEARPVFVWGTGEAGRAFVRECSVGDLRFEGWIDSDSRKTGTFVDGARVQGPEVLRTGKAGARPFVFVASMYHTQIVPHLVDWGFEARRDFLVV